MATIAEVGTIPSLAFRPKGRPRNPIPTLYRHKQTNVAYVSYNGRTMSFGPWGDPSTEIRYKAFVAQVLSGESIEEMTPQAAVQRIETRTVNDLALLWLAELEKTHRKRDKATSYVARGRIALDLLKRSGLGSTAVNAFGPRMLKEFQAKLVRAVEKKRRRTSSGELVIGEDGKPVLDIVTDKAGKPVPAYSRQTINEYCKYVVRMYKWAVSEEIVDEDKYRRLATVEGLARGRSPVEGAKLRDDRSVQPVSLDTLKATIPHLSSVVRQMIEVQLLGSMRPAEVCHMRAGDVEPITQEGKIVGYVYNVSPEVAKLDHLGVTRTVYFGPRGAKALAPLLAGKAADEYLFSPRDAREEHDAKRRESRQSPRWASHTSEARKARRRTREVVLGDHYRPDAYARAIRRACKRAGVPHWTPNQIRHTAATLLAERTGGLDPSRLMLGHSSIATTAIYAKSATRQRALEVAIAHG